MAAAAADAGRHRRCPAPVDRSHREPGDRPQPDACQHRDDQGPRACRGRQLRALDPPTTPGGPGAGEGELRSEEHTSELQSLMRISYAVFCLKKKTKKKKVHVKESKTQTRAHDKTLMK